MIEAVRTDTIAISHVLFFALASAAACDLGKGDDAGFDDGMPDASTGVASFDDGIAESSTSGGYDSADTAPVTTFPPDPSETSTSGGSGCDASHTTDPTTPPDTATSAGETYGDGDEGVGSATSGSDSGPLPGTEGGTSVGADTDGNECFAPVGPGNFEYGCLCEDATCDIYYEGVEQIPEFDGYCNCLCQANGCGEAVGGVAEGGGEEG